MTAEDFFAAIGVAFSVAIGALCLFALIALIRGSLTGRRPLASLFGFMDDAEEREEYR